MSPMCSLAGIAVEHSSNYVVVWKKQKGRITESQHISCAFLLVYGLRVRRIYFIDPI